MNYNKYFIYIKFIVSDADNKEFRGKDDVAAKKNQKKIETEEKSKPTIQKEIIKDNDDWESF